MTKLFRATQIKPFIGTSKDIAKKLGLDGYSKVVKASKGKIDLFGFKIEEIDINNHKSIAPVDISKYSLNQLEILKDKIYSAIINFERVEDE